jgi:3-deoxy-D-manno-octulosonic-acid transferase
MFLYNLFIKLYVAAANTLALTNNKARLWVSGRKAQNLLQLAQKLKHPKTVWMHCASLGEFEQGRPLIEKIKQENNDVNIVVSFFSASGYEVQKNYSGADIVCYLPIDTYKNATEFIALINPQLVLWIKYDYWLHFLLVLKQKQVPVFLISAIFRSNQVFFKWYGAQYRQALQAFTKIFVQNADSKKMISKYVTDSKIIVSGDTRFDRVLSLKKNLKNLPETAKWIDLKKPLIIAGSTWPDDEEELVHYVRANPNIQFLIAPHHIDDASIADTKKLFSNAQLYTELQGKPQVIILNTMGMLAQLYAYATITYIGGGFGNDGVHNVLEAAAYGKPVVHGPEYEKYAEATGLIECGGSFAVSNALELENTINRLLQSAEDYKKAADAAENFVAQNGGATQKIYEELLQILQP